MSLLTPEALAWIGRSIEFTSDPITVGEARRFVAATGDDHPAYPAAGDAGEEPSDDAVAPPMLYYGVTRPFASETAFAPDGTVEEHRPFVGAGQTMGGTVEVEWERELRLGDRLRGVRTLRSLEEKAGRSRAFVLAIWITDYFDETGARVIRERYEQILF